MKKNIVRILLLLSILTIFANKIVMAAGIDDIIKQGQGFLSAGTTQVQVNSNTTKTLSDQIYNILLVIGVVTAVIVSAILGIKFMFGSSEEQADVKKKLVPFIAGCVVIFGAFGIWKLVVTVIQGL